MDEDTLPAKNCVKRKVDAKENKRKKNQLESNEHQRCTIEWSARQQFHKPYVEL